MMTYVREGLGFNPDAVDYWTYELVALEPPVVEDAEVEPGEQEAGGDVTPRAEAPVATLTLYLRSAVTLVLEGDDAERVRKFYSVPSSQVTHL